MPKKKVKKRVKKSLSKKAKKATRKTTKKTTKKKATKRRVKTGLPLLKELIEAHGPSGNELAVRAIIEREIRPYVDNMFVDKLGNLIAHKKGKGKKVMLAAHMDEIGLMVKEINEEGHIKFATIGGIEPITLIGQTVRIYTRDNKLGCHGVITFPELHEDYEIKEMPELKDLYIDTGLDSKQLAKKKVEIGSYVIARHHFKTLGNEEIISGKALDDRVGCYILIEVARKLKKAKPDIFYVFTVQEEIGLYGAEVSTYQLEPDWGLAIDTINAEDSGEFVSEGVKIGKGPTILLKDAEIITNKCLDDWIRRLAKAKHIPVQLKVEEIGTTDATKILVSKESIPATTIAVPVRNIHSTVGVSHMKDVVNTIKLVIEILKKPPRECIL